MDTGLAGRVVCVTGGTGGIGRAVARAFAAEGARVAITYHQDVAGAQQLVAELGGDDSALAVPYELADDESAPAVIEAIAQRWGGVDVLVAGAIRPPTWRPGAVSFEDVPAADWVPFVSDNVHATIRTIQAVIAGMRRKQWGRVVFISTHLVQQGAPGREFYAAAKAALHGVAGSLAWDVGRDGILVNVVAPGLTLTARAAMLPEEFRQREIARTPSGRLTSPEDVANAVLFLGSALNGNITGATLTVTGGR